MYKVMRNKFEHLRLITNACSLTKDVFVDAFKIRVSYFRFLFLMSKLKGRFNEQLDPLIKRGN